MKRKSSDFYQTPMNWWHFLASSIVFQILYTWFLGLPLMLIDAPNWVRFLIFMGACFAWVWWLIPFNRGSIEDLLCCWFEYKDIEKQESLYLRRWFLITTRWGCVYLHRIVQSDDDPDPHDHPWDFTTILLKGSYLEELYVWAGDKRSYVRSVKRDPFHVYKRPAETIHQVKLLGWNVWTLVFRGPYRRHWNFVKETGPVFWRDYLDYHGEDTLDPITKGDIRAQKETP